MEASRQKKTLSKEKVKVWVRDKMDRGRWIYVADIPHLNQGNYLEFVEIIKEMIDGQQYGDQEIWIELDSWHVKMKIFEYSGFYKAKQLLWKQKHKKHNQVSPGSSRTGRQ